MHVPSRPVISLVIVMLGVGLGLFSALLGRKKPAGDAILFTVMFLLCLWTPRLIRDLLCSLVFVMGFAAVGGGWGAGISATVCIAVARWVPGGVFAVCLVIAVLGFVSAITGVVRDAMRLYRAARMTPGEQTTGTVVASGVVRAGETYTLTLPPKDKNAAPRVVTCAAWKVQADGKDVMSRAPLWFDTLEGPAECVLTDARIEIVNNDPVYVDGDAMRALAASLEIPLSSSASQVTVRWISVGSPITVVGRPEWVPSAFGASHADSYRGSSFVPRFQSHASARLYVTDQTRPDTSRTLRWSFALSAASMAVSGLISWFVFAH